MMNLKEKKMLLKMKTALGESVEHLRAEIEAEEAKVAAESASRKAAFENIFSDLSKNLNELAVQDKKRTTEQQALVEQLGSLFTKIAADPQVPQEIKEQLAEADEPAIEPQPKVEPPKPTNVVDAVVAHVNETAPPSMFVQPNPSLVDRDIKAIQNKLKLLEGWVSKISMNGPGGGAGEIYNLDMPTRAVVGDYTIQRKDYYIGVDSPVKCYITLPSPVANGREVVIKDESGHAQLTPIKIIGNIDNDPNGAEIRINNGSVTLIYRNGWRII